MARARFFIIQKKTWRSPPRIPFLIVPKTPKFSPGLDHAIGINALLRIKCDAFLVRRRVRTAAGSSDRSCQLMIGGEGFIGNHERVRICGVGIKNHAKSFAHLRLVAESKNRFFEHRVDVRGSSGHHRGRGIEGMPGAEEDVVMFSSPQGWLGQWRPMNIGRKPGPIADRSASRRHMAPISRSY